MVRSSGKRFWSRYQYLPGRILTQTVFWWRARQWGYRLRQEDFDEPFLAEGKILRLKGVRKAPERVLVYIAGHAMQDKVKYNGASQHCRQIVFDFFVLLLLFTPVCIHRAGLRLRCVSGWTALRLNRATGKRGLSKNMKNQFHWIWRTQTSISDEDVKKEDAIEDFTCRVRCPCSASNSWP